jgi:2-oxo-4-hydroxy-4-carboxy-5-ureidoimidazoline decarboxylase
MSGVLARWNLISFGEAAKEILPCCGSTVWAKEMAAQRPFSDEATLLAASDGTWRNLARADWMEAFQSHPRIGGSGVGTSAIGESQVASATTAQSLAWSAQEQYDVAASGEALKAELAQANREYERRFNHIFIVCATGKSAPEILAILRSRMRNDTESELHEAAEQQRLVTQIRLKKWLSQ